ncbi:MAG: nucleotide exchange factor GrpE [Oscillospiraceae bacterium]|nr:nucleotide exchange factor GrpE [Oscillospiraceae bacterium]
MAKRDKAQPVDEAAKNSAAPQEEEKQTAEAAAETFTVTREQMEQLENLAATMDAEKDKYLRLAAEYDNYRKRTAREKESIYADAKTNTVREFLAVYDNLECGVSQYEVDSPHRQGVEMIFKQFKEILAKLGVTEMDALGKPFDPELHNAVMHIEDPSLGENVITEVFQQGFMLGGKVLRVAIVKVAN